jgi:hypothetical protein
MASQAIKSYDDFAGQDGYLIVDGLDDQTPGGKKLLSELCGSNVPNYPTDVATNDTKRYNLTVYNQAGDLQVVWEDETYYDVANNGGLAKDSGGNTISFSIDTDDANDGDVLTFDESTDSVVWSAPAGGDIVPDPQDLIGRSVGSGGIGSGTLKVKFVAAGYEDPDNNGKIVSVRTPYWDI